MMSAHVIHAIISFHSYSRQLFYRVVDHRHWRKFDRPHLAWIQSASCVKVDGNS